MTDTFVIAVYGAILSTVLGCITIYSFIRDRRIIRVEKHLSYTADDANYDFVISNISSRPFTIIDCMVNAMSQTGKGKLEIAWGIAPMRIDSIYGDDKKSLDLPMVLHPGEVLIVGISSADIIRQLQFDNRLEFGIKWNPTKKTMLEISHSMSKKLHEVYFELDADELERAKSGPAVTDMKRESAAPRSGSARSA